MTSNEESKFLSSSFRRTSDNIQKDWKTHTFSLLQTENVFAGLQEFEFVFSRSLEFHEYLLEVSKKPGA